MDQPGDPLIGPVTEVYDGGDEHELEAPRNMPATREQVAAFRAVAFVGQFLILDEPVALVTPRHETVFPSFLPGP